MSLRETETSCFFLHAPSIKQQLPLKHINFSCFDLLMASGSRRESSFGSKSFLPRIIKTSRWIKKLFVWHFIVCEMFWCRLSHSVCHWWSQSEGFAFVQPKSRVTLLLHPWFVNVYLERGCCSRKQSLSTEHTAAIHYISTHMPVTAANCVSTNCGGHKSCRTPCGNVNSSINHFVLSSRGCQGSE